MPEIKNTFTQGKMNKDLDERLVPNGQYRDALNIQVSTSEASDVGAVTNILGNIDVFTYNPYYGPQGPDPSINTDNGNQIDPTAKCIGAIADEKNNCFYWFVYSSTKSVILKYIAGGVGQIKFIFVDTSNDVLEFSSDIITGINIIEDYIYWTDGKTEPKKLDVKLAEEGTHQGGHYHTRLIIPKRNIGYSQNILFSKENITVIKPNPKAKLIVEPKYDEIIRATVEFDFANLEAGSTIDLQFDNFTPNNSSFKEDDVIIISENGSDVNLDEGAFHIKLLIETNISNSININTYTCRILNYSADTPQQQAVFNCLKRSEQTIFPRKFIRFGYRYRYNSGEYSAFSSFTDPIFKPGSFNYSAKDAYNLAMENNLLSVKLRNFIPKDIPGDVIQVDLLYTESDSPTVYIVDKIKFYDHENVTQGFLASDRIQVSNWVANLYEVTSDLIYAAVPENQLIRHYDSVPITALAQEVTGSRIIYANYEQNYDVETKPIIKGKIVNRYLNNEDYNFTYHGNFTNQPRVNVEKVILGDGQKSIKTMRNYQVGVSYLDAYGRQTPVFTSDQSEFKVPKKWSQFKTQIETRLVTTPPSWADSYKVYVKETSTEYYNVAMSNIYRATTGDVWLSFPSAERNKIDEETYLILKKGQDTKQPFTQEAKYKVLAIENEVPKYVKEQIDVLVSISCGNNTGTGGINDGEALFSDNAPQADTKFFDIEKDVYNAQFGGAKPLTEITSDLYVAFKNNVNNYTKRYKINEILDTEPDDIGDGHYSITLKEGFDPADMAFIYNSYPTTTTATGDVDVAAGVDIVIYTAKEEDLPEFEGVFFVKINADAVAVENIFPGFFQQAEYETTGVIHPLYFSDGVAEPSGTGTTTTLNTTVSSFDNLSLETSPSYDRTNSNDEWLKLFEHGQNASTANPFFEGATPGVTGGFFIDKAVYVGVHPQGSTTDDSWDFSSENGNNPNHVYNSSEHRSDVSFNTSNPGDPNGLAHGKGIYEENGQWFIELSFGIMQEHAADINQAGAGIFGSNQDPAMVDFQNINRAFLWEPENSDATNEEYQDVYGGPNDGLATLISKINLGSFFRFRNQTDLDNIFEITSVEKIKRYNYVSPLTLRGIHALFAERVIEPPYSGTQQGILSAYNADEPGGGSTSWPYDGYRTAYELFTRRQNRRVTYKIGVGNKNLSDVKIDVDGTITDLLDAVDAEAPITLNFIDVRIPDGKGSEVSTNPAIFETEPKKNAELDFYYEATEALPLNLNNKNSQTYIPLGSVITCPGRKDAVNPTEVDYVENIDGNLVTAKFGVSVPDLIGPPAFNLPNVPLYFTRPDGSYTTAYCDTGLTLAGHTAGTLPMNKFYLIKDVSRLRVGLSWFNCFTFNNGVESNRIRDDFNEPIISKGVRVSSITDFTYEREKRKNGLIFSGIYNSNTGVNDLNQFILAENITKDLNPTYGSIQKLFQRESDLVVFCEDRVISVMANKDTLFNADGSSNVVASTKVLGNANPFSGDYGISTNPESFAKDNYRAYFTDKQRGVVLRLSMDGLTPISNYGMNDYFKDTLKSNAIILGSYDNKKEEYNITMPFPSPITVSYKENVKGWPSFKSFVPEQGLSIGNEYFTFLNGIPFKHHDEFQDRNTFYGVHTPSSINVLLNQNPSVIKSFKTLNYEGSKSKIDQEKSRVETGFYNLQDVSGWYSDLIQTDKQTGSVPEFIEKEGKWFNYIRGDEDNRTTDEFSFQGIGKATDIIADPTRDPVVYGCTNQAATNYDPLATVDDGSCVFVTTPTPVNIGGCMDPLADNYDSTATFDDGSCVYTPPQVIYGCTNPHATNYNAAATVDDGSCIPVIYGCTDPNAINYFSGANYDDGSCLYSPVLGCTDPQAINYDPTATVDDGSCVYLPQPIQGCTDPLADNYDPLATQDDGSCVYTILGCTDPLANNYDPAATQDDGSCTYDPTTPFSFRDQNDDD